LAIDEAVETEDMCKYVPWFGEHGLARSRINAIVMVPRIGALELGLIRQSAR
jgi:hypothetical protein